MTSRFFAGALLLACTLSLSSFAGQEPMLDPDLYPELFDDAAWEQSARAPEADTAKLAAQERGRAQDTDGLNAKQLSAQSEDGSRFSFAVERGSDIPGWNDDEIGDIATVVPKDRGIKLTMKNKASGKPVTEVTVGGYVKADFIYDFRADLGMVADPDVIPISGKDRGHFRALARESRVRIKSKTATAVGDVRTLIEFDFLGGAQRTPENRPSDVSGNQLVSDSNSARMRHAWAEWDFADGWTLGAGQFWTLWTALGFWPTSVDFTVTPGTTFLRQPQLRLSKRHGDWTFYLVAANPETDLRMEDGRPLFESGASSTGPIVPGAADRVPDFMFGFHKRHGKFMFKLLGLMRFLMIDDNIAGSVVGDKDCALGWGIQANSRMDVTDRLTLVLNGIYGDGVGRYMYQNFLAAGFVDGDDKIRTAVVYGFDTGFVIKASETVSFNGWYGFYRNWQMPALFGIQERAHTGQVNIIWAPVSAFKMGFEVKYSHSTRRAADGDGNRCKGNLRLHGGAWYFF